MRFTGKQINFTSLFTRKPETRRQQPIPNNFKAKFFYYVVKQTVMSKSKFLRNSLVMALKLSFKNSFLNVFRRHIIFTRHSYRSPLSKKGESPTGKLFAQREI